MGTIIPYNRDANHPGESRKPFRAYEPIGLGSHSMRYAQSRVDKLYQAVLACSNDVSADVPFANDLNKFTP